MSSDTFRYWVKEVAGRDVVLQIQPTTAGGLCDLAWSRSFVLMLMREGGAPVTCDQTLDESWLKEHLGEYVTRVVPERLVGYTHERTLRSVAADWCIPAEHLQPSLTVRATLANEAMTAYLPEGTGSGTTAFDVWYRDPEHVALAINTEMPPTFDAMLHLKQKVENALRERLSGWQWTPLLGLHKVGADAQLCVRVTEGYSGLPRSAVEIEVTVDVPAFTALPAPARAPYGRTFLVSARLHDGGAVPARWFRHFAHDSFVPRVEYFDDDAPQESMESFIGRIVCAVDPPGLDALLTRDGLRGLVEQGMPSLPLKKGQTPTTPLDNWVAPAMPVGWHWEWKHGHRWRSEPIWNRIALHAAFGTRDEARAALAQARAISKQVPAIMKPLIASLDAK